MLGAKGWTFINWGMGGGGRGAGGNFVLLYIFFSSTRLCMHFLETVIGPFFRA